MANGNSLFVISYSILGLLGWVIEKASLGGSKVGRFACQMSQIQVSW